MIVKALSVLLAGLALVCEGRPHSYSPEYTALTFASNPGKCAGSDKTGKVVLVNCCDKSVLKLACLRPKGGPLASYCELVTPAAGGGVACGYLKAAKNAPAQNVVVGSIVRDPESPDYASPSSADAWIKFTRWGASSADAEVGSANSQWTISDANKTATNLCMEVDAAGAVKLAKCMAGKKSQLVTSSIYTGPGVNGQCFSPPEGGKAVLINSCPAPKNATQV